MANVFGPKLGLLYNANIGEYYADNLRTFLQALDQLIMGSVINATTVVPPSSPTSGDSYLLTGGTPSGAWTGQAGKVAVWNTQVTLTGTNTQSPAWVFYTPKPGWILWNVALSSFIGYNGSSWVALGGGGANFPVNTDITSMTALDGSTSVALAIAGGAAGGSVTITTAGGAGGSNAAIFVTNGIQTSGWSLDGVGDFESINVAGTSTMGGITVTGTLFSSAIIAQNTSGPVTITGTGTVQAGVIIQGNSGGALGQQLLLGFTGYPTQTTVGAAGGATALPATPTGYLPIVIGSTEYIIPYYARV